MLKHLYLLFLLSLSMTAHAQSPDSTAFQITTPAITYGPTFTYGFLDLGQGSNGHLVEVGFWANQRMTNSLNINVGVNISAFTKIRETKENRIFGNAVNVTDSIYETRSSQLDYASVMLSFPLRGEFYFWKTRKIAIVAGIIPRIKMYDKVDWAYTEEIRSRSDGEIISQSSLIEENPSLAVFNVDVMHIGLQFYAKKWKITPIANLGSFTFKDGTWLGERGFGSLLLELSYRL